MTVDKLKLTIDHTRAIPRHVLEGMQQLEPINIPNTDLKVYRYFDQQTGVFLSCGPQYTSMTCNPTKVLRGGDNYQMIDFKELVECVDLLSEMYATDFRCWNVGGFDLNVDILTEFKPASYLKLFGTLTKANYSVYHCRKTGVTYTNDSNTQSLSIYDVHRKRKKEKEPIPPGQEQFNKLRIEMGLNSKLNQHKALKQMKTLSDYLIPENYVKLPVMLYDRYQQVDKGEPVQHVPDLTKRESDMLAAITLQGLNAYRDKLRAEYPKNFSYHNRQINQLMEKVRAEQERRNMITLVAELHQKIKAQVDALRASAYQYPEAIPQVA